jgi:hypothetical protein
VENQPKFYEHYGLLLLFAYFAILRLVASAQAVPRAPLLLTFLSFCVWTILLSQGTVDGFEVQAITRQRHAKLVAQWCPRVKVKRRY